MHEGLSIAVTGIYAWIKQDNRSFYVILYLMLIFKHLFTNDQGSRGSDQYSGKWKNNGRFLQVGKIAFSGMTLLQISFCMLSAILVIFGDRMPHSAAMIVLCALQLCGYAATIIFSQHTEDSVGPVHEIVECMALIYVTLDILPAEVKYGLSCWRYAFLSLTLISSFSWIVSMMQDKFNRTYLVDILPLGGLCATSVMVLVLKAIGFQNILFSKYDMFLNISTLFWTGIGISISTSPADAENPPFSAEYHPWSWLSYRDSPYSHGSKRRLALIYAMIICVTNMCTFNVLSAWRGGFESLYEPFGTYSINEHGYSVQDSLMKGKKLTYFAYLITVVTLVVYGCAHIYMCLPARRAYNTPRDAASKDSNDVLRQKIRTANCRTRFAIKFIFIDFVVIYIISVLMSSELLVSTDMLLVILLILSISGFVATIAFLPGSCTSDMSRYILAHVGIHSVILDVLSPYSKHMLSRWKNVFLVLSQLSAEFIFILRTYSEDTSFKNATLCLMLCVTMLTEVLVAVVFSRYFNRGTWIGKLGMETINACLYGYNFMWFFVSVCLEIGCIILSELEFRNCLEYKVFRLISDFCRIVIGSIMFHVGPMLMYSLLTTWYLQYESNTGQQKQF